MQSLDRTHARTLPPPPMLRRRHLPARRRADGFPSGPEASDGGGRSQDLKSPSYRNSLLPPAVRALVEAAIHGRPTGSCHRYSTIRYTGQIPSPRAFCEVGGQPHLQSSIFVDVQRFAQRDLVQRGENPPPHLRSCRSMCRQRHCPARRASPTPAIPGPRRRGRRTYPGASPEPAWFRAALPFPCHACLTEPIVRSRNPPCVAAVDMHPFVKSRYPDPGRPASSSLVC